MFQKIFTALAFVVLAAAAAHAQPGATTGGLRGKIVVPDPRFGERVEIIIERTGELGQRFAVIYTDSSGDFFINGLPLGSYTLVVKLDGYKEVRERVDMGNPDYGANIPTRNIILSRNDPEKDPSLSNDSDVIDVKELSRKYAKKAVDEFQKGQEENRKGNTERAIQRFENAVKLAPDFDYAHYQLGVLYEKSKRFAEAEREYKQAHELNSRMSQPLINLGRLYLQEAANRTAEGAAATGSQLEQARSALKEALKLQPNSSTAYYLLGVASYRAALDEEAEAALQRALETGDRGEAHLVLANVYIRNQKWAAAVEHLDAYLKGNPKSADRANIQEIRSKVVQNLKVAP